MGPFLKSVLASFIIIFLVFKLGAILFRMFPKTPLHRFEILNTIHPLGVLFAEHETAECSAELLAAGTVRHAAQTGAVPVYFAGFFIEGALLGGFFFGFIERGGDRGRRLLGGKRVRRRGGRGLWSC